MFQQSVDQLAMIIEKFIKGNEDHSNISKELRAMRLFNTDHFEVFQVDKPLYVATLKSLECEIRENFFLIF